MQPNQRKTKSHYPILDGLRGEAAILIDEAAVIIAFLIIVAMGAGGEIKGRRAKLG